MRNGFYSNKEGKMTWDDVPGYFDFQDIYDEMVDTAPIGATLVEVGTLWGRSAFYMAEAISSRRPDLKMYVVDKWEIYQDHGFNPKDNFPVIFERHGSMFEAFAHYLEKSNLAKYIRVMRMESTEAAKLFEHVNPYFVFIDANHSYHDCLHDIMFWDRCIGRGCIIAGHDQSWDSVKRAINDYFGCGGYQIRRESWLVKK